MAHIDSPLAVDILYRANKEVGKHMWGPCAGRSPGNPAVYMWRWLLAGGDRCRGGGEHIKQAGDSFIIPSLYRSACVEQDQLFRIISTDLFF